MSDDEESACWEPTETDIHKDITEPLTGKPFFCTVMCRSHLEPHFHMVVPKKMQLLLPVGGDVPLTLTHNGTKWEMTYNGRHKTNKRFDKGWKRFAVDNNLVLGDACVFELISGGRGSHDENVVVELKVQILRCGFPLKLIGKANIGESNDNAILVEDTD